MCSEVGRQGFSCSPGLWRGHPLFSLLTSFFLQFGERFEFDCKNCICLEGGRGIICQPRKCSQKPLPECKEDGTYLVTEVNPDDTCCTITSCSKATPGGGEPSLGPWAPVPSWVPRIHRTSSP